MSLTAPYGPPNRPPCGGFEARKLSTSCFNHSRKDEKAIDRYVNVTKISGVAPSDGDACPTDACSGGDSRIDSNCYHHTNGDTIDVSNCHKRGIKRVMARKFWLGVKGFYDDGTHGACEPTCDTGNNYLTATFAFTYVDGPTDGSGGELPYTLNYAIAQTLNVNQHTGAFSRSACSESCDENPPVDPTDCFVAAYTKMDVYRDLIVGCWDDAAIAAMNVTTTTDTQTFAVTETTIHYHLDRNNGPGTNYVHVDFTITLSNAYSFAACVGDAVAILANFPLDDDKVYPWVDGWADCNRMPILFSNENGDRSPMTFDYKCTDTLPDDSAYDGSVIGTPLPAGYGPHYSCRSREWNPTPVATATEWNSTAEAAFVPEGGFIFTSSGSVYVGKFAEIQDMHHSHNFFRPCGADRDALAVDGETLCWDGRDAAHPKAWPICGRALILTAVYDGSDTTFTTYPTVPYLRVGDYVDITGFSGGTEMLVTEVAGDTWTVDGDHSGAVGAYVTSFGVPGPPNYEWNDNHPKGDFRWQDYVHNGCDATVAATCTDDCIGRNPCWPSVMCYSPNGETFPNGKVRWPGAPAYHNGAYWVGIPTSQVPDPIESACNADTATMVEARCTLPTIGEDTAPALPEGITWGCPSGPSCGEPGPGDCRADEDEVFVP